MVAAIALPRMSYPELEAIALQLPPEERERLAIALLRKNCPTTIINPEKRSRNCTTNKQRHFPASGWIYDKRNLLSWKSGDKTKTKALRGLKEKRFIRALQRERTPIDKILDALDFFRASPDSTMITLLNRGVLTAEDLLLIKDGAEVDREAKELVNGK